MFGFLRAFVHFLLKAKQSASCRAVFRGPVGFSLGFFLFFFLLVFFFV